MSAGVVFIWFLMVLGNLHFLKATFSEMQILAQGTKTRKHPSLESQHVFFCGLEAVLQHNFGNTKLFYFQQWQPEEHTVRAEFGLSIFELHCKTVFTAGGGAGRA